MSNDTSHSKTLTEPDRDRLVRLFKLSSGDEIVGVPYGTMDEKHLAIMHPAKLLLTGTDRGMAHFLAPFSFDPKYPVVAVAVSSIVYTMVPAPEIRRAYNSQVVHMTGWQAFAEQNDEKKALASQAVVERSENGNTLH
jgi:hypothetical protein